MATILHSIDTGGPGGAETVFVTLAAADTSHHNLALAKPGGWVEQALDAHGVSSQFVNTRGSFNRAYLGTIIRLIRENNIDLVQSHLFGSNLYCAIAGRLCGVPVVSAFHGAQDLVGPGLAQGVKRQLVQRGSSALVAVSHTLRSELLAAGFSDTQKLQVVHNGILIARFANAQPGNLRSELGIPADARLIGAVGNVRKPKGYEVLVAAMAELQPQMPALHLVIAGQGDGALLDTLKAQIAEAGLDARVHLPGFVADTPGFFASIDACVSSSHSEGFGLSCVEAMASHTPVIATRSGGPEEILEHGKTGILVPTADAQALADAIRSVLLDSQETERRVSAAFDVANRRFSVESMVRGYKALYDALLKTKN